MGGPGGGRYIGHTLLFTFVVTLAFFLWKKRHGAAAFVGLGTHLLLDIDGCLPWFYPFKDYEFYDSKFSFMDYLEYYLSWEGMGFELVIGASACIVALIIIWIRRHYRKSRKH